MRATGRRWREGGRGRRGRSARVLSPARGRPWRGVDGDLLLLPPPVQNRKEKGKRGGEERLAAERGRRGTRVRARCCGDLLIEGKGEEGPRLAVARPRRLFPPLPSAYGEEGEERAEVGWTWGCRLDWASPSCWPGLPPPISFLFFFFFFL